MEEKILDNIIEKTTILSTTQKVFRVIEGILRLLFFGLITLLIIVASMDITDLNIQGWGYHIGYILILVILEFFFINHLIQGIRCFLIKEYKTFLLFPFTSLIGLLFIILTIIVAFIENIKLNPNIYEILPYIIFCSFIIYLFTKEFINND